MSSTTAPIDRRLTVYTMALLGLGSLAVYGASSYDATLTGGAEMSGIRCGCHKQGQGRDNEGMVRHLFANY